MLSLSPIERTIASERGCKGRASTRWFHGLSAGKTGQPARTAVPIATLPYKSAGLARRAEPARLALGQPPVAPHVAVFAARDEVERGFVAHVLDLADGRGIHAREAAGSEHVLRVVVQGDLHAAAVDEVELLLLFVEVATGGVLRGQLDRVHSEGGHAELSPDLAEARPFPERIDVRNCIPVALNDIVDLVLVSHVPKPKRLRLDQPGASPTAYATFSALRRPPRAHSVLSATRRVTTANAGRTLVGSPTRNPRPASITSVTGFTDAAAWTQPVSSS